MYYLHHVKRQNIEVAPRVSKSVRTGLVSVFDNFDAMEVVAKTDPWPLPP